MVSWRPDKEEKRCRYCGRSFNLRRRKHHCRLCGDIVCKQCSQFMSLSETCEGRRGRRWDGGREGGEVEGGGEGGRKGYDLISLPIPADPVLSDCPDFRSLAPPIRTSVLSLKRGWGGRRERGAEERGDDKNSSDMRLCSTCHKLIHRSV